VALGIEVILLMVVSSLALLIFCFNSDLSSGIVYAIVLRSGIIANCSSHSYLHALNQTGTILSIVDLPIALNLI
jgi:hypothetical protein